jgi:hypothetical protein
MQGNFERIQFYLQTNVNKSKKGAIMKQIKIMPCLDMKDGRVV